MTFVIYIKHWVTCLFLMALFSVFQVTVMAIQKETFCSNIEDVKFHLKTSH